jgi:hypothetical protein
MLIRKIPLILFLLAAFIGCNSPEERKNTTDSDTTAAGGEMMNTDTPTYYNYKNTRLAGKISDTAMARFSNDTTDDCFTLYVPSGLITETQTTIRVSAANGALVYEHVFPTRELVNGYATEKIRSDAEMEQYVIEQAKSLLKQGLYPANNLPGYSSLKDAPAADFENYEVFTRLRDSGSMIFHYRLLEETHFYLGYDAKQKKVVHLIHCC